jgi:ribonuclease HI
VRIEAWTDGSGIATGGPGGWAFVMVAINDDGEVAHQIERSGPLQSCTNQRAEMVAAVEALSTLKRPTTLTLYTDSEYLQHGFTHGWIDRWQDNGWRNRDGAEVANRDLWEFLILVAEDHTVTWEHIRGHQAERRCECGWSGPLKYRKCQECGEGTSKHHVYPFNARADELAGMERRALIDGERIGSGQHRS